MKTLLAVAITAILLSGCSSSDDDAASTPLDDPITSPDTDPGVDTGSGAGLGPGTDTDPGVGPDGDAGGSDADTDTDTVADADGDTGDVSDAAPSDADVPPLDAIFADVLVALGAYPADTAVARVIDLADSAIETASGSRAATGTDVALAPDADESVTVMTTALEHDCALGGRFVSERAEDSSGQSTPFSTFDVDVYRFDDCRLAGDGGEIVVGGDLVVTANYTQGSRADDSQRAHEWRELTVREADGGSLEIDGRMTYSAYNDSNFNDGARVVELARYVRTAPDGRVERLDDVSFSRSFDNEGSGLYRGYRLDASGTVTGPATGGTAVTVETATPFTRVFRSDASPDDELVSPFAGELSLRSDAGGALTATARDTDDEDLSVDVSFVGADGTVREIESVPFPDLAVPSPSEVLSVIEGS